MRSTEWLKLGVMLIAALALGACASKQPPPPPVVIPVSLVNIEDNTVVIPTPPDTGPKYKENDTVRDALGKWLEHGKVLQAYETDMRDNLMQCTIDNSKMRENLHNIKKFILLNQGPAQPGPN